MSDPDVYDEAERDFEAWWERWAKELDWFEPWQTVLEWDMTKRFANVLKSLGAGAV